MESSRPEPQPLTAAECLELLAGCTVGRIAVVHEGYPVVLPVNFVLSRMDGAPVIAIRTRPGNVIDHTGELVAFEVDGVDAARDGDGACSCAAACRASSRRPGSTRTRSWAATEMPGASSNHTP